MFSASLGKVRSNILKKIKIIIKYFSTRDAEQNFQLKLQFIYVWLNVIIRPIGIREPNYLFQLSGRGCSVHIQIYIFFVIVQVLFMYFSPRDGRTAGRSVNYQIATIIVFVFLFSWLYCNSPPG